MGCFWLGLPGPVISDHSLAIQWLESLSNSIKGESPSKTLALHSFPLSSDRNPLPLFPSLISAAPPPQIPRWFLLHHRWSRRSSLASSRRRPRVSRRPPPPPGPLLIRGLSLSPRGAWRSTARWSHAQASVNGRSAVAKSRWRSASSASASSPSADGDDGDERHGGCESSSGAPLLQPFLFLARVQLQRGHGCISAGGCSFSRSLQLLK